MRHGIIILTLLALTACGRGLPVPYQGTYPPDVTVLRYEGSTTIVRWTGITDTLSYVDPQGHVTKQCLYNPQEICL